MMNGLNILPSYTNYFILTPTTTGLDTASIFIGGFFGPLVSGIISDHLGRRPAICWGSAITLIGVLLQTAAQDIEMFVIARIVLGFGAALSGIAGGVYLSETFPSQWRAWGVGMMNNFYWWVPEMLSMDTMTKEIQCWWRWSRLESLLGLGSGRRLGHGEHLHSFRGSFQLCVSSFCHSCKFFFNL
jgi:MFS family permease